MTTTTSVTAGSTDQSSPTSRGRPISQRRPASPRSTKTTTTSVTAGSTANPRTTSQRRLNSHRRPASPRSTKTTTTSVTAGSTANPRTSTSTNPNSPPSRRQKPNSTTTIAIAAILTTTACGPSTKKVVLTSLDTLAQEQATLGTIASSPALQDAARKLSTAVVDGTLDALSAEDRAKLLETRTTALIEALTPVLANSIQQDIGPAVRQQLNQAIRQAVHEATTGPTQGRIERLAAGISQSIADVLLPQVGPAVGTALRTDILPALEDSLKRTILEDNNNLIRTAVREGMTGLADALNGELGQALDARTAESTRILVAELDHRSSRWETAAYALGAGIFGIAGLGWWGVHTRRKRIDLVENTLLMVMQTIKDNEAEPAIRRTVRGIRSKGRDKDTGAVLKELLKKRPELRVEPAPEPAPEAPPPPAEDR
jgi:hypothetical protein